jgi:hypothetical protein
VNRWNSNPYQPYSWSGWMDSGIYLPWPPTLTIHSISAATFTDINGWEHDVVCALQNAPGYVNYYGCGINNTGTAYADGLFQRSSSMCGAQTLAVAPKTPPSVVATSWGAQIWGIDNSGRYCQFGVQADGNCPIGTPGGSQPPCWWDNTIYDYNPGPAPAIDSLTVAGPASGPFFLTRAGQSGQTYWLEGYSTPPGVWATQPSAVVLNGSVQLYGTDANGIARMSWWDQGRGWFGPSIVGAWPGTLDSPLSAVSMDGGNTIHIFGMQFGNIWYTYLNMLGGAGFGGWSLLN